MSSVADLKNYNGVLGRPPWSAGLSSNTIGKLIISQPFSNVFIVGAEQLYTTISDALAAVTTTPAIVMVSPGTYTENLTLVSGVSVVGCGSDSVQVWSLNDSALYDTTTAPSMSVKVVGTVSFDCSASTSDASASLINIWVSPPASAQYSVMMWANATNVSGGYMQALQVDGCRVDNAYSGAGTGYALYISNGVINTNRSLWIDTSVGDTGAIYTTNPDIACKAYLNAESCRFAFHADSAVVVAATTVNQRFQSCVVHATFRCRAANSVFSSVMRETTHYMTSTTASQTLVDLLVASVTGSFEYSNCRVFLTTAAGYNKGVVWCTPTNYPILVNNTQFGGFDVPLFGSGTSAPSIDRFLGGTLTMNNCTTQTSTIVYQSSMLQSVGAGFSETQLMSFQAAVATVNGSTTTLATVPLQVATYTNCVYTVRGTYVGRKSDNTDHVGGDFFTVVKVVASISTIVGSQQTMIATLAPLKVALSFAIDGSNNLLVQLTDSSASNAYYWTSQISFHRVSTNA